MKLSIVTTLYRSESFIEEFHSRASIVAASLTSEYEIIFVNDGCPGKSLEKAKRIVEADNHVKLVELSRNFGHHFAAYAAIEAASGEKIFLLDVDLEESPEWLIDFQNVMESEEADLVYGVQRERPKGLKQGVSRLFYKFFNSLTETKIPQDLCTVRLMSRDYRNALLQMREKNIFLAGMMAWMGFSQVAVQVDKKPRKSEKSTYTPIRSFKLLVDAITSFSPFPLYLAFFLGLIISAAAGLYGTWIFLRKILEPDMVMSGYTSLIISIFFMGGLMILFMGVIGIYLSKVFVEVKGRPRFVIRNKYGFEKY